MEGKPLSGKVAIVTGAGRGIGAGISRVLSDKGALVLLADVDEINLQSTLEDITARGGEADFILTNVADPDDAQQMVSEAVNRFGDLHILVNNAGINRDAIMHKMTDEQWDQVIAVNLSGVFYCSRAAIQYMRTREYGRIINISSAGWQGNIGQANYAAAKAGVIGLTKTIAKENARKRITCNAICPGFIDTKMTRGVPSDVWKMMVGKIPMGYVGEPEDIGKAVAFLASDDAAYITAEVLNVGGGFVL
jgi:3-oxoacyl-[acyl-carrier protein] reductase/2-hydroxycyclohexanecarboxyl-CoA dehydrogenase